MCLRSSGIGWTQLGLMWKQLCRPMCDGFLRQGDPHVRFCIGWTQLPRPVCPAALAQRLAENSLRPDHETNASGDCGPDSFLRSAKAAKFQITPLAKKSRAAQIQAVRDAGKEWLIQHAKDVVWGEWSVRRFCQFVSGCEDFTAYCTKTAHTATTVGSNRDRV